MNRPTQTTTSGSTETRIEAGAMKSIGLSSRKVRHARTGEMSQAGRRYGFPPAFFDERAGDLHLGRFPNRQSAPSRYGARDHSDENLRNRRFRTGSLRLYREQTVPVTHDENKDDRQALTLN